MLERFIRDEIPLHPKRRLLFESAPGLLSDRWHLTNLLRVVNVVSEATGEGSYTNLCLLNFSKAFDVVKSRIIYAKLAALKIADHQVI